MSDLRATVDTETLGFKTDSVIVSIGYAIFDMSIVNTFQQLLTQGINIYLEIPVQFKVGRTQLPETLEWWSKQKAEAKECLTNPNRVHPKEVAGLLNDLHNKHNVKRNENFKIYCRGPEFDIAKITDLCSDFNLRDPWHYRSPRDCRTWYDENHYDTYNNLVERPKEMIPHNSLHDACFEAWMMQHIHNGVEMERSRG